VLRGLPAPEEQLFEKAAAGLPAAQREAELGRAERLKEPQRAELVKAVEKAMAALPGPAQENLARALLGDATPGQLEELNGIGQNGLKQLAQGAEQEVPPVAVGEPELATVYPPHNQQELEEAAAYLREVYERSLPHYLALVERAVALRSAPGTRPLLLELDLIGLEEVAKEVLAEPQKAFGGIAYTLLFAEPAQTQELQQEAAKVAGFCTGQVEPATAQRCGIFQGVVVATSGVKPLPGPVAEAAVNCVETPVCTREERELIERYVREAAAQSKEQQEVVERVVNRFQETTEATQEAWTAAFEEVREAG